MWPWNKIIAMNKYFLRSRFKAQESQLTTAGMKLLKWPRLVPLAMDCRSLILRAVLILFEPSIVPTLVSGQGESAIKVWISVQISWVLLCFRQVGKLPTPFPGSSPGGKWRWLRALHVLNALGPLEGGVPPPVRLAGQVKAPHVPVLGPNSMPS